MLLLALGINHKTAPVQVRERVAFPPDTVRHALNGLRTEVGAREAAILSTCNRTELYCGLEADATARLVGWLGAFHRVSATDLEPYIYHHPGPGAVRHMLRVAAGLDSMLLGEPQILGQVKTAYRDARSAGTLGKMLDRLFQHSFAVAKQIRTDTAIGSSPVSVAFAAVSLSRQIFADLSQHTALLIGAGETVELVARHLHEQGTRRLVVANRTLERAHALAAQFGGYAIELDEIGQHLLEADIVISSTASPGYLLEPAQVRSSLKARRHRPLFMVDLAVPRDIHPLVGELEDVYLYSVDDLQGIIVENLRSRREAARQAEEIVDVQVDHFMAWMRSQDAGGHIRNLRRRAERDRDALEARALADLARGRAPEQVVRMLAHGLTNRLLHAPTAGLREAAAASRPDLVAAIARLYDVPGDDDPADDS